MRRVEPVTSIWQSYDWKAIFKKGLEEKKNKNNSYSINTQCCLIQFIRGYGHLAFALKGNVN